MQKRLMLILYLIPQLIFSNTLTGFWRQPDQGLLFSVKTIQGKPIVQKVYNYTELKSYCVIDALNTKAFEQLYNQHIVSFIDANTIQLRRFSTSLPSTMHRLAKLPRICSDPLKTNDPVVNYWVLWQFFHEYYANFELRLGSKSIWKVLGNYYAMAVNQQTTPDYLFQIMSALLTELADEHINLYFEGDFEHDMNSEAPLREDIKQFNQSFADSYTLKIDSEAFVLQLTQNVVANFNLVDNYYLNEVNYGPEMSLSFPGFTAQPVYSWGLLKHKSDVGYLRILQELHFEGSPLDSTNEHYASATKTIDSLMTYYKRHHVKTLIIVFHAE